MRGTKLRTPGFKRIKAERGACFHNAMRFALRNTGWDVVHGIPLGRGPLEGQRFAHGWNEVTQDGMRWAYDAYADLLMPAALYYHFGCIEYAVTYSALEVARLSLETQHSGPWDEKIDNADHEEK